MSDRVGANEAYILDQAMQAARRLLGPDADADVAAVNGLARELAWIFCARGQTICEQGQPSDALFFLIRGRALAVYQDEATGLSQIVGEIGRGETIGEMGILTGEPRSLTVVCSRDSELLRLDRATFERLVVEHPRILLSVSQTVIERLRRRNVTHRRASTATPVAVAMLPAGGDDGSLLAPFAEALATALGRYGPSCHVSAAHLPAELSDALAQNAADPRVVGWLNDLEQAHRFVVLQAEAEPSPWTERCIRQADRRLLVARTETSQIGRAHV